YLHDLSGRPITELSSTGGFNRGEVYASGRHMATYANNTTYFDYSDWLGTERMRAIVNGDEQDQCTSLPYGADLNCAGGTDYSPMHFTGQVRDAATGLDHFPARNYTSAWGRWMTPDWSASPAAVPYATFSDPQSLDLYAYARDNPVTNTDPSGHWCFIGVGTTCAPKKVKGGPKLAGPDWLTRCQGNLTCSQLIMAGLVRFALQQAQFDMKHPLIGASVFILSAFGPEAEEGAGLAEGTVGAEADTVAGGASEAAAPVGRRGAPMEVRPGTNAPAELGGTQFSGHALDEMQSEGFTPSVVRDTIGRGAPTEGASGRVAYYSHENNITVVTESGRVVTVTSGRLRIR
ncbi:MAG: RHS repeat-associated core domain-containing protein, partial [Terriglobales bacterium]